jgi:hypothetical protein
VSSLGFEAFVKAECEASDGRVARPVRLERDFRPGWTSFRGRYFLPQPASLLQASCAFGFAFSHCVIERVSLFDILLFMQLQ